MDSKNFLDIADVSFYNFSYLNFLKKSSIDFRNLFLFSAICLLILYIFNLQYWHF